MQMCGCVCQSVFVISKLKNATKPNSQTNWGKMLRAAAVSVGAVFLIWGAFSDSV